MEETGKFLEPMPIDRDATLATPRFDEVEAQVARPVVPLTNSSVRRGGGAVVRRRQWPIALVLISALAGGVVSLLAFRLYQQRQQQSQVAATQADNQTPETEATTTATAQTEQPQQAQSDAPVVFEEFDPAKEGVATSGETSDAARARKATAEADAKPSTTAGKDERKEEAKPSAPPRAAEPRPRLIETIPASRPVQARGENVSRDERADDDDGDFFEERRERRRQRREQRREGRRGPRRNIDRIKDIFEGPPPA